MSEPSTDLATVHVQGRPFPWFCPNCRRQEVRRVTIPYECQRFDNGQPITVVLSALEVPRCEKCGELVFTYETEEQINKAFRAQIDAPRNAMSPTNGVAAKAEESKSPS
jgi:predicted RNA-binding Zn-ribbon protein involved in translation (DUF1610 family)